jgi:hypothetical protein
MLWNAVMAAARFGALAGRCSLTVQGTQADWNEQAGRDNSRH